MVVGLVGATGLVGTTILKCLEQRDFPFSQIIPIASERSRGMRMNCKGKELPVYTLEEGIKEGIDIAFFSAGGAVSTKWAPQFAEKGAYVIDNSSAWRMHENVPLIVPEVNSKSLRQHARIIANPNCSTIQLVVALAPLHQAFTIQRIVVSTYQSVSGSGMSAVQQLWQERANETVSNPAYLHPIDLNLIPHIDVFLEDGYTKEEQKIMRETKKILDDASIAVTATAVRVPVVFGHGESVNVEFVKEITLEDIYTVLREAKGLQLEEDSTKYAMPKHIEGNEEVFVSRIRKDPSQDCTFDMWIVADNILKGAATNAIQIAELLNTNRWL